MKLTRLAVLILITITLTSCQTLSKSSSNQPALPSPILIPGTNTNLLETQPYQNLLAQFQINLPKSWVADESGTNGTVAILYDPQNKDTFSPNINIAAQSAPGASLQKLIEDSKKSNTQYLADYKIVSEKDFSINGTQGYLIDATFTQGQTTVYLRQLLLMPAQTAFAITARSKESDWKSFEPIAQAAIMTFKPY